MSDLSQESPLWREWAESRHSVQRMREELERLRAENAALLAANRDCLTHFEDMNQDYTGLTHFVSDLRAVFSLNECGFTELINVAIQSQEDAVRYRWMLDHASAEEWREWGKMDAYDDVERAIDKAMQRAAECGNGVGITGGGEWVSEK